jgi:prepilin-type N-terminal cleavage/methylation domain-containing protein
MMGARFRFRMPYLNGLMARFIRGVIARRQVLSTYTVHSETPKQSSLFSARRGFSLLELSVVLGIIALIAGVGVTMASGALKAADRVTTQERLNTIKLALDSHAKLYGYYPCPARRDNLPSATAFGIENRSAGTPTTCDTTGIAYSNSPAAMDSTSVLYGVVPVRSLGLPDSYAGDAWGNKFTYAVSANMVGRPWSTMVENGNVEIRTGQPSTVNNYALTSERKTYNYTSTTVAGTGTTFNGGANPPAATAIVHFGRTDSTTPVYSGSYTVTSSAANSFTIDPLTRVVDGAATTFVHWLTPGAGAAYAVVSHGADGRGAIPLYGTALPTNKQCVATGPASNDSPPPCAVNTAAACIDIQNCNNNDAVLYDSNFSDGPVAASYFDDYIVWGSNALERTAVNDTLYTTGGTGTKTCTTTPQQCEPWCAVCDKNFPANTGSGTVGGDVVTAARVLCRKIAKSNATDCRADCYWSGTTNTATGTFYPCP